VSKWKEIKEKLPNEYFVDKIEPERKLRPEICFVVIREVTEPVLARNSDPERAEITVINNQTRARINGEKFVSAERITGLNLCRMVESKIKGSGSNEFNIIHPDYKYNEPLGTFGDALNPDSIIYGVVGTGEANYAIKSRVIEGYTYTTEPYDIINKEQHNALYETGTMFKSTGEHSESLYTHVNIEPPTKMVHFIRISTPTKEMVPYVLHNILNTTDYFARSTRKGHIRNHLVGLIFSRGSIGLSTGELLKEMGEQGEKKEQKLSIADLIDKVKKYVGRHKNALWKEVWEDSFKDQGINDLVKLAKLEEGNSLDEFKEILSTITSQARETYCLKKK